MSIIKTRIKNINIDQGSTFTYIIIAKDIDGLVINLTGYTTTSYFRKSFSSSIYTDLNATITNPTAGEITLTLSAAQTAALKAGRYVYDTIIDSTTQIDRIQEGNVVVNPAATY